MLELQFILTYDNSDYIVTEPKGFQDFNSVLERDFDSHGVFFKFTDQDLKLSFPGTGRDILKAARDGFGVDAEVSLTVKRRFRDTDPFSTIYTGDAVMEDVEIDQDFAHVDFEETNEMIQIRDRIEVPVRSTATESLDGDSISAATETDFTMGAKTIRKVSSAIFDPRNFNSSDGGTSIVSTSSGVFSVSDILWLVQRNELEYETGNKGFIADAGSFTDDEAIVGGKFYLDLDEEPYTASISLTGSFSVRNPGGSASGIIDVIIRVYTYDVSGPTIDSEYEVTSLNIAGYNNGSIGDPVNPYANRVPAIGSLSVSTSTTVSTVNKYAVLVFKEDPANPISGDFFINASRLLSISEGIPVFGVPDITLTTQVSTSKPDTDVSGYFIHESIRHNLAMITGDEDFLYAPYFGTTADGYSSDGCAWNFIESNGWRIRGFTNAVISSLKTRLDSLKSIFGVGYGLERTQEGGPFRFRIDQYEYFYNDALLYDFGNNYEDQSYIEEFYDWFSFNEVESGYKTSITDENEPGSTEDFNSMASWVLPTNRLKGKKSFVSEHIGSDLLQEITRRIQFETKPTTSYKYDDNLFLTEVDEDGTGGYELGERFSVLTNGAINPLYNKTINPKFNLFNQYPLINTVVYRKNITDFYKNTTFKNGGEVKIFYSTLQSSGDPCLGDLTETSPGLPGFANTLNQDFSINRYRRGRRLFDPILIKFKIALSSDQVDNIIEAHRNGSSQETIITAEKVSGTMTVGQVATDDTTAATGVIQSVNGNIITILQDNDSPSDFGTPNPFSTSTGSGYTNNIQVNSANNGYFRVIDPDGETKEGWLLRLSFNYADQIGIFELIKKAEAYSL